MKGKKSKVVWISEHTIYSLGASNEEILSRGCALEAVTIVVSPTRNMETLFLGSLEAVSPYFKDYSDSRVILCCRIFGLPGKAQQIVSPLKSTSQHHASLGPKDFRGIHNSETRCAPPPPKKNHSLLPRQSFPLPFCSNPSPPLQPEIQSKEKLPKQLQRQNTVRHNTHTHSFRGLEQRRWIFLSFFNLKRLGAFTELSRRERRRGKSGTRLK